MYLFLKMQILNQIKDVNIVRSASDASTPYLDYAVVFVEILNIPIFYSIEKPVAAKQLYFWIDQKWLREVLFSRMKFSRENTVKLHNALGCQ